MSTSDLSHSELMGALEFASRKYSTSTVLFHNVLAERLGLNPTDHKCVDIMSQRGPITAGQLAEITGLTTGTITAVLDRLEKANFIKRVPDPNDRRKVLLELIPDRFPEVGKLFESMLEMQKRLLSEYTQEELALILDYTIKFTAMMDDEARKMRAAGKK